MAVLMFGFTAGLSTRVEDPGCYVSECHCYLYSEIILYEGAKNGDAVDPYTVNCCISTKAYHYDMNNNPLNVSVRASGVCRHSFDGGPWYLTYVSVSCDGYGEITDCVNCEQMFTFFEVGNFVEAEAIRERCSCSDN